MTHESITLWGYRTGGLETPNAIRNSFAFDLTELDLRRRTVLSASLHLGFATQDGDAASVQLTDPSEESEYGSVAERVGAAGAVRIPLSTAALADLREARSGFFWVSAVVRDAAGQAQWLSDHRSRQLLVLTVAESAGLAAA